MSTLINSLLHFLNNELSSDKFNDDQKESLQVAIDCIQSAYNVNYDSTSSYHDLPQIFNELGLENIVRKPQLAEDEKIKGNELLGQGKVEEAIACYTKAIELDCSNHIYFGNRAAAYIKLNKLDEAIEDCYRALYLKNDYSKAYARLGTIYMCKKDYATAKSNLSKACELEPENVSYRETLEQCEKLIPTQDQENNSNNNIPFSLDGLDFNSLMNNPAIMNVAKSVMQNPRMQEVFSDIIGGIQDNPSYSSAFENILGNLRQPNNNNNNDNNNSNQ